MILISFLFFMLLLTKTISGRKYQTFIDLVAEISEVGSDQPQRSLIT